MNTVQNTRNNNNDDESYEGYNDDSRLDDDDADDDDDELDPAVDDNNNHDIESYENYDDEPWFDHDDSYDDEVDPAVELYNTYEYGGFEYETQNKTKFDKACFFFAKGTCRNGDSCPFRHERSFAKGNNQGGRRPDRSNYRGRLYEEVNFYRPDGDTEGKDIGWCLGNGFFEIEPGLWSGDWFYRHHPNFKTKQQIEKEQRKELAELETPLEERKFCLVCKAWFKTSNELQDHITFSNGKAHRRYQRELGMTSTTTLSSAAV
jgi:hypothetical protein